MLTIALPQLTGYSVFVYYHKDSCHFCQPLSVLKCHSIGNLTTRRPKAGTHRSSDSRTTQQGMVDALVDLVCLSRTTKIFGSYWSAFSETAAALGETEVIVLQNPK